METKNLKQENLKGEETMENKNQETKEIKKEELKENKEAAPKAQEKTEFEKSLEMIRNMTAKQKELKIMEQEAKTGYSFFSGKNRLCKILKSKRGITLEINVKLPEKFKDVPEIENISAAVAYKKHLGTMKHLYRGQDIKLVKEIITSAIEQMKLELKSENKEEEKKAQ